MTVPSATPPSVSVPISLQDIGASTLLGISFSLKPAGVDGRCSAARTLLALGLETIAKVYPEVLMLDLSEHPMPLFDGRLPRERDDPAIAFASACVARSGALLLSVPAYWAGVSGVFKNFVDCLCGPAYELDPPEATVFADKAIGVLVVGADEESTHAGVEQATSVLRSTGAQLVGEPVALTNPRGRSEDAQPLLDDLVVLAACLAQHAHRAQVTAL